MDLALINTNYAIEAKLSPTKDALFIEGSDSPYTNIVAARGDRANGADIAKLMNACTPRGEEVHPGQNTRCRGARRSDPANGPAKKRCPRAALLFLLLFYSLRLLPALKANSA